MELSAAKSAQAKYRAHSKSGRTQSPPGLSPAQKLHQALDVVGQGIDPIGDGPETTETQGVQPLRGRQGLRQAPKSRHHLQAVALAVAVCILVERCVARPMPGVLNAPAITHMPQQSVGTSTQTLDLETGFVDAFAASFALAAHRDDHGAAKPVLFNPCWGAHGKECSSNVSDMPAFTLACLVGDRRAVGQVLPDHLKPLVATVLDGNQQVGSALLEVEKKGRFACNASACTNTPSRATCSSNARRAVISPPSWVASVLWAMATPSVLAYRLT
jgi:hypothetical protein